MKEKLPPHDKQRSLSELVEKAGRHWEARRRAAARQRGLQSPPPAAFTIALEREVGTQGSVVGEEVGHLLGWHVYDHELLEKIAEDMALRTSLLESVDERRQSFMLEAFEAFMSAPENSDWGPLVAESNYVHHLVKTVLALGTHGECIIVGRGAGFILPVESTLRVRLVGTVRERIAALSQRFGISERDAARQIRTQDRERIDFVRDHFSKDPTEPQNYDLVVNAPRLSVTPCAEVIVEALRRLEARRKETGARAGASG